MFEFLSPYRARSPDGKLSYYVNKTTHYTPVSTSTYKNIDVVARILVAGEPAGALEQPR